MQSDPPIPVILASGSAIRRQLLASAGVVFEAVSPGVDEDAAKEAMRAENLSPRDQADGLAELKAVRVSARRHGLVIGCDQMLELDGQALDKANSLEEARSRLKALRGKTHALHCGCVIARDGQPIWRTTPTVRLTMRPFSDRFLEEYLERDGKEALSSVGCYQLESGGAQLFSAVVGDYFSILGLPLIEVLEVLRRHGGVPS